MNLAIFATAVMAGSGVCEATSPVTHFAKTPIVETGVNAPQTTYENPLLPADFSDIDCITYEGKHYAITSTMQLSPGMAVLESEDMVNWRIVGHAVADVADLGGEDFTWKRMRGWGNPRERRQVPCVFRVPRRGHVRMHGGEAGWPVVETSQDGGIRSGLGRLLPALRR